MGWLFNKNKDKEKKLNRDRRVELDAQVGDIDEPVKDKKKPTRRQIRSWWFSKASRKDHDQPRKVGQTAKNKKKRKSGRVSRRRGRS